jgi:formylglycine-generating enzyme required for sulfatase activity/serine/threonine protein kinase
MATNDSVKPERPDVPRGSPAATTGAGQPGAKPLQGGSTVSYVGGTLAQTSGMMGMPTEFGRYRVQKQLGGGGMGAVYLVENTELKREEALKVPHFGVGDDPQMRERFLREARSAAQLDHANLCPVYDVGEINGVCFLTMRYLKGKLLSDYTGKPQPPRKAVEITAKLAQALESAHARGVIHRDLKPNNVMMCAGVGPVVMDFGLAKQTKSEDQKLTQAGTTLGTPSYMPPEQVKGQLERMGPASDVYSLGVILFELLTGRLPFKAATVGEVYGLVLHTEAPAPSSLRPGLDLALDAICAKALAKAPEDRYPSMKAFAAALIDFLKTAPAGEGAGNLTPMKAAPADIFQAATVAPDQAAKPIAVSKSSLKREVKSIFEKKTVAPIAAPRQAMKERPSPVARMKNQERTQRQRKWLMASGAAAVALVLLGLIGLGAAGVFKVKTADGILIVQVNEPNAEVFVDGGRTMVSWNEGRTQAEIHVKPGTRKVEVRKAGFSVDGTELTFKDGDRVIFTARLVSDERPMAKADAPPEKSPPPPAPVETGKIPADVTNSIGMKLKLIKAGKFLMGSPNDEEGRGDAEVPRHEVEITKAFYLGVYPVTRGQFAAFAKDADYTTEAEIEGTGYGYNFFNNTFVSGKYSWRQPGFKQTDDHPVVEATWNDATAFCAWLSTKEGKHYELPTEAEWEYACRAGTKTRFWCGDAEASLKGNANIADASFKEKYPADERAVSWDDGYAFTSPVGSFKANPWGLYDMHGNVYQWCADYYDATYYQNSDKNDPLNSNKSDARVLRGGSWGDRPQDCRAASRWGAPGYHVDISGFRVALRLD